MFCFLVMLVMKFVLFLLVMKRVLFFGDVGDEMCLLFDDVDDDF